MINKITIAFCLCLFYLNLCYAEFKPLPRIKAVSAKPSAKFINTATGLDFIAVGSSYVNLWWLDDAPHHCNFTPGLYDKQAADDALSFMSRCGYTMVRIFVDKGHPSRNKLAVYGVDGPYQTNTEELYKPYMDNLIDFLNRATKYRIYVVLAFEIWPYNSYYTSMAMSGDPDIEGANNRTILSSGTIAAKEIYLEQFVKYIHKVNPDLFSTILAYDIQNELYCRNDQKPFSLTQGLIKTANGKVYDMSDTASRQACQDENTVNWSGRCITAIKKYDPQAMTTTSLFPFWPLKKIVNSGLLPLHTEDKRWPVSMPFIIEKTDFDFIDIHPYLGWQGSMEQILNSSQWDIADKTKKPVVAFEFGAHRFEYRIDVDNVEAAAQKLFDWRRQMFELGFVGASLFTWHTESHTRWTMLEDGGVVNSYMRPCPWWSFVDENSPSRWIFNIAGWKFKRNLLCDITPIKAGKNYKASICSDQGSLVYEFGGGNEPMYLDSPWITMNAFSSLAFNISIANNSSADKLTLSWLHNKNGDWQDAPSESFPIEPNNTLNRRYSVNLDKNKDWNGQVYKIRITSEAVLTGSIEITELGFINRIDE